jgi:iron complex transport system substrate-binding protein
MFPVNTEQIILLSPDIVLATMEGSSREDISTLRQLGQVVYVMPACAGWRDLKRNFIKLARLLGEGEKAQRMIKEWEERLARMSQRGYPRWRTFCQIGTEPLFTVAKGSHIDEIITRAGLINVFHDAPLRYPRIDREAVLKTNPELILVVTMGEVTARERDRWLLFDSIEACRANRILVASEDLFCSPDPRSFVEALEWLRSRCRGLIVREGSTRPQ